MFDLTTKPKLRRLLAAVVLLAAFSAAFALSLPRGTKLALHDQGGALIGLGEVDDDRELEFDMLRGQTGTAVMTVRLPDATLSRYDVFYGEGGAVLVVVDGQALSLREVARLAGLGLDFDYEGREDLYDDWEDDWDDDGERGRDRRERGDDDDDDDDRERRRGRGERGDDDDDCDDDDWDDDWDDDDCDD